MTASATPQSYPLGHDRSELERLVRQSQFLGATSEHLLRAAGLGPGMRVLDVGCGMGDLSFIAAGIVGPTGSVTGVDRSPESVAEATMRARALGIGNVTFVAADAATMTVETPVDALIGRLVLMYWPDAAGVLRRLRALVRPGGIVTFQEYDLRGACAEPPCPLFETSLERLCLTFGRVGAETRMGLKLGRVFEDAGLPAPEMRLEGRVERGPDAGSYELLAGVMRTLLPAMVRTGVATAAELDIDTLASRLKDEALALDATTLPPPLVAAWSRHVLPAGGV